MEHLVVKDVQTLRRVNTITVLDIIRNCGPVARTKLARMTGLTPATAFAIVEELVKRGLVREIGLGESEGGRRPRLYAINPDAPGAMGLEVRGSRVIAILMDLLGEIKRRYEVPLRSRSQDDVVSAIESGIEGILGNTEADQEHVIGIGIAMPGILDTESGVAISSSNFGWSNLPICRIMSRRFGLPVILEHNVRAFALGESWFGAGREVSNLVCINVGVGISAGIIINNELYRGQDESSGELGHICVDEDGPRCGCGSYGCLEALASETAILRRAAKAIKQGASSLIADRESLGDDDESLSFSSIIRAAREGDSLAISLLKEGARYLGIGVAMVVNLLNPELVIIGGEVTEAWDIILPMIEDAVKTRALRLRPKNMRIVRSSLGIEASSIGAATLVLRGVGLLPSLGSVFLQAP